MSDEFSMTISVPTDDDGYVLLKCSNCGAYFKITPTDMQDEGVLEIFCPSCGLAGKNYITEDVLELAFTMTKNKALDIIYEEFRKMERQFQNSPITFKMGKPPRHEPENPIRSSIEAMEIVGLSCCKRSVKIKPILKMTGCYCPFCGVKNYEVE
ncbi:MAG: TFIIB-type zinc ribbon-containing protein [Christensenellales bacterium]|nr:TFIIB-type zinc ribbon-containing protein [Christensenellales bacterium]